MRRWAVRLLILLAVAALLWLLQATLLSSDPVPVTLEAVERGRVEETVTNSRAGTVKARRRARLSPEIGGQVIAIPYREGERVQGGEVVLELDASSQRAQLELSRREAEAARAERERACLAAERAARELARMRRLAEEEIVAADMLDAVESSHQTAAAGCRSAMAAAERAEASVDLARTQLAKTVLRAPFDGVVADLSIEVGEWTTPSPPALPVPPVIDILDPASIYVSAPMDEVDSARIAPGMPVRVTVDSHRDRTFEGAVRRVAPYVLDVEEQNRTVEIEVDFDPEGLPLLPGTSADVEVILEVHEDSLRIPTTALIEGERVLVIEEGVLTARQVETGIRNWDFVEVLSGLAAGERIVTSLDRPEVEAGVEAVPEDGAAAGSG